MSTPTKVLIVVRGGHAYVVAATGKVEVTIIDHDVNSPEMDGPRVSQIEAFGTDETHFADCCAANRT